MDKMGMVPKLAVFLDKTPIISNNSLVDLVKTTTINHLAADYLGKTMLHSNLLVFLVKVISNRVDSLGRTVNNPKRVVYSDKVTNSSVLEGFLGKVINNSNLMDFLGNKTTSNRVEDFLGSKTVSLSSNNQVVYLVNKTINLSQRVVYSDKPINSHKRVDCLALSQLEQPAALCSGKTVLVRHHWDKTQVLVLLVVVFLEVSPPEVVFLAATPLTQLFPQALLTQRVVFLAVNLADLLHYLGTIMLHLLERVDCLQTTTHLTPVGCLEINQQLHPYLETPQIHQPAYLETSNNSNNNFRHSQPCKLFHSYRLRL